MTVLRHDGHWAACYGGEKGKLRPAPDLVIPASVSEADLERYLADLCHEWATDAHPDVRRIR